MKYATNWDIISSSQEMFNIALKDLEKEGIEFKTISLHKMIEWANKKPYPYPKLEK